MDISKLNKADVLAVLYNNAKPRGLGFLHYTPAEMTREEAQKLLDKSEYKYFDYVNGRVIKIDMSTNDLHTGLYNRDNGLNAAERAIASLFKEA